ncbi:MAG TPA: peptidase S1 [Candidatus Baltobacteraceae bacterium]|jgi:carboxypeptidase C (cathepsin A)|nr:peptidase S1 [Candidatus Baltobacteraceae bacterium]
MKNQSPVTNELAYGNSPSVQLARLLCVVLMVCRNAALIAAPDSDKATPTDDANAKKKTELPIPKEESSVTRHEVTIGDKRIPYIATAGNLLIRKGDDPTASMFYVAYTRDGVTNMERRPVTFFYNGGPGSSTIWLHMGSFGPRIVATANAQASGPAPYHVLNNADTLLDRSDLVFIDAVSTGFSRVVGKGEGTNFWGVDGDVEAFGNFITRYVTLNHRWNSPKFLFGESYGTTRSAALVYHLQQQGMYFNGVVLLSSILNYAAGSPGLDDPFVNNLPSYAAIAWFHFKLPNKPDDLEGFLQQVRDFATGEFAQALAKGQTLPAAQEDAVAAKLHDFTGLSVSYLKEANLRVDPSRFRKELLRDERRTVGRYDGRFEGIDFDAAGERPASDPSDTAIAGAFTAAFNSYLADELNYTHDTPYQVSSSDFSSRTWDFKHKLPEYLGRNTPFALAYVVDDLAQAMRDNPRLMVLSANGYFDLATPFFATERDLNHMELDPTLRTNVTFRYYPSGHMVYLNPDARKTFRADLASFYDSATQP